VSSNDHHAMPKKTKKIKIKNKQTNKPKDEANVFTLQFLLSHPDVP
jgi:hypothetical protein